MTTDPTGARAAASTAPAAATQTAVPAAPMGLDRVVRACRAMVEAGGPLPTAELAGLSGCSERQLVRLFSTHAGTTPRAFGQAVRAGEVRRLLREHEQVTEAIFAAGFGSVRSFYETASPTLGMNPRQYATGAPGQALRWTTVGTDLGQVLAVAGDLGLAAVRIGPDVGPLLEQVRQEFPAAHLEQDDAGLADLADGLRALACGDLPGADLPVDLHGTAFQARVWDALRRIPAGQTRSYTEVAEAIGSPTAVRAVASACGANPVALVIPCHRVVRSDGSLGGYRWGLEVKRRLLETEGSASPADPSAPRAAVLANHPAQPTEQSA